MKPYWTDDCPPSNTNTICSAFHLLGRWSQLTCKEFCTCFVVHIAWHRHLKQTQQGSHLCHVSGFPAFYRRPHLRTVPDTWQQWILTANCRGKWHWFFFGGDPLNIRTRQFRFFFPKKNAKKTEIHSSLLLWNRATFICSHTYVCLKHLRKPSFCICFGWFFPSGTPPAVLLNLAGRWRSYHGTRNGFTSWYRSWEHGCAGTVGPWDAGCQTKGSPCETKKVSGRCLVRPQHFCWYFRGLQGVPV